jgi:hypothetical protein
MFSTQAIVERRALLRCKKDIQEYNKSCTKKIRVLPENVDQIARSTIRSAEFRLTRRLVFKLFTYVHLSACC